MVTMSSLEGVTAFILLFICSCSYLRRVPRLRAYIDLETAGPAGIIFKAAIVGMRFPNFMTTACLGLAVFLLVS
jgi:hypothetical protein